MTTPLATPEEDYELVAFPDGTEVLARCGYCSEPAFFLKNAIQVGDALEASNIVNTDGRHTRVDDPLKCGSCDAWFVTPKVRVTLQERGG